MAKILYDSSRFREGRSKSAFVRVLCSKDGTITLRKFHGMRHATGEVLTIPPEAKLFVEASKAVQAAEPNSDPLEE